MPRVQRLPGWKSIKICWIDKRGGQISLSCMQYYIDLCHYEQKLGKPVLVLWLSKNTRDIKGCCWPLWEAPEKARWIFLTCSLMLHFINVFCSRDVPSLWGLAIHCSQSRGSGSVISFTTGAPAGAVSNATPLERMGGACRNSVIHSHSSNFHTMSSIEVWEKTRLNILWHK